MKSLVGQVMDGRYRVLEQKGEEAMAAVYTVSDQRTGVLALMKVLVPSATDDPEALPRFQRECELLQRVDSPHVARYLGHGEDQGIRYLLVRFEAGRTVLDYIGLAGGLPAPVALGVAHQAASGLLALHDKNILHRALSPENLILTPEGRVVLMDCVSAKSTGGADITRPGFAPRGSLAHMAPEVINGRAERRSDVYSLGATLFHMLTGRPPFEEKQMVHLAIAVMKQAPPRLGAVLKTESAELQEFLDHCLDKDPSGRFHSVDYMLEAIEGLRTVRPASPAELRDALLGIPLEKLSRSRFWLVHESGAAFEVERSVTTVGRHRDRDVDLSALDAGRNQVSRKHARIEQREAGWVIAREAEATNPVWVNVRRLGRGEEVRLELGDVVRIGPVDLLFTNKPPVAKSG